jgi:hypothetical protein
MTEDKKTGIEVNVVDWKDGNPREVAIHFRDFDQMITMNAEGARSLAFLLVECADFIEPPFVDDEVALCHLPDKDNEEEESFFGAYDEDVWYEYEDEDEFYEDEDGDETY